MITEKIIEILVGLTGLLFAVGFKYFGRSTIEYRKKLNRILPFSQPEKDFNESAVLMAQIMFLIIGILAFFVGLVKFLT